ncbi:Microtubule associated protein (MAP65/ASE1 family) [Plasmodiophora brassicae]
MGIQELPGSVVQALTFVWDELGLPDDERRTAQAALLADVDALLSARVASEKERVNDARHAVESARHQIMQMHEALGDEGTPSLPEIAPGVSLLEQVRIHEAAVKTLTSRTQTVADVISQHLLRIQSVYQELGMDLPEEFASVGATDLTPFRLTYIEAALEQAMGEKRSRRAMMDKLLASIGKIAVQLSPTPIGPADYRIDMASIEREEKRLAQMQKDLERHTQTLEELRAHVEDRWTLLKTDMDHVNRFRSMLRGVLHADIAMYEQERTKLDAQYQASVPLLIQEARTRIRDLHRELRHVVHDDDDVDDGFSGADESLLTMLESREKKLRAELEKSRAVLQLVAKWEKCHGELCEGKREAQAYANDPNRFHGRQAFKMLKKEEDLRRLETKVLPRLQEKLFVAVRSWEAENGSPLMVEGVPFLEAMQQQLEKDKENELQNQVQQQSSTLPAAARILNTPSPAVNRRKSMSASLSSSRRSTPDSVSRAPRRTRLPSFDDRNGLSQLPPRTPTSDNVVERVLQQADAALASAASTEANSRQALKSVTDTIHRLEYASKADPAARLKNADALCDLYHKRSVIYTAIGEYDAALEDSEAALAHGNRNYSL